MSVSKRLRGKTRGGSDVITAGSDLTPLTTWEQVGSLTLAADPSGGRLSVYKVSGSVSGERGVGSSGVNVLLGYSIEEVGGAPKTAPDATIIQRNGVGLLDCTNGQYSAGEHLTSVLASAPGKNFNIRLWAKYIAETGSATKICWTGVNVWYDEDVFQNSGVRQATVHQRRRM